MATEVVTSKAVNRDQQGIYIESVSLRTNRGNTYIFEGRAAALWANRTFQKLQSITPAQCKDVRYVVERAKHAA